MVGVKPVDEAPIGLCTKLRETETFEMYVMLELYILVSFQTLNGILQI